jgi:hypothetical protein
LLDARFIIKNNLNRYGYINDQGDLVIYPDYSVASQFSDGLAAVQRNGKYGYIDIYGNVIIGFRFEYADDFHNGCAAVGISLIQGNSRIVRFGVINKRDEFIIEPKYRSIGTFYEGLAVASLNNMELMGYIDEKGDMVIPEMYYSAYDFSEGLASVSFDGKKEGYINNAGSAVIQIDFKQARYFSNGLAAVKSNNCYLWGFIDRTGDFVISPQYLEVGNFSEELSWGLTCSADNEILHYFDTKGNKKFNFKGSYSGEFSEEFCAVEKQNSTDGRQWGYINRNGELVIDFIFDMALPFYNGIARISTDNSIGYINKMGEYVWKPQNYKLTPG